MFLTVKARPYSPAHGCPCGNYRVNVTGKAEVYSWWVIGMESQRVHEKTHVDVHCRRAFDSYKETSDYNATKCMTQAKAECVARVIEKEMLSAYALQAVATAKEWDCDQYGKNPGSKVCLEAAAAMKAYAEALEKLNNSLRECETR
jgi:hypothetical protein